MPLLLPSLAVVALGCAATPTRRVWRSPRLGSLGSMELETVHFAEAACLKGEEVCVKVTAIGLNFADIFSVLGLYSAFNELPPCSVAGLEFSGVVEAAGPAAPFLPGDRVFGFTRVVPRPCFCCFRRVLPPNDARRPPAGASAPSPTASSSGPRSSDIRRKRGRTPRPRRCSSRA